MIMGQPIEEETTDMTPIQTADKSKVVTNTYRVSGQDPYISGETKKKCKKKYNEATYCNCVSKDTTKKA
jgi:hypothetical protein